MDKDKVCSKCKEIKKLDEFYNDASTKDGKQRKCIQCFKKYAKENKQHRKKYNQNHYIANKEAYLLKALNQRNTPGYTEFKKEYDVKYRCKHYKRLLEQNTEYRESHRLEARLYRNKPENILNRKLRNEYARDHLVDSYIKYILRRKDIHEPSDACIDLKRAQLEEYRLLKQLKDQRNAD